LDKKAYEHSLGKILKAQLDTMIDFLASIPQFGGGKKSYSDENDNLSHTGGKKKWAWSKTALSRLSYFFKEVQYRRGNIIYKEKDPCQYVYIVLEGEFELQKQIKLKANEFEDYNHKKHLF
jgi:hypothetical protein